MATKPVGVCTTIDPSGGKAVLAAGNLWEPGTTISVCFLDGPQNYQDEVQKHLPIWSQYANLKFSFDGDASNADVRVSFVQGGVGVYNSWVGKAGADLNRGDGQPTMHLGFDDNHTEDMFRMYTLHEFGHVLGLCHEHQSPALGFKWNTQAVYDYYLRTNPTWTKETVDNNILTQLQMGEGADKIQNYTAFDGASIMLYPVPPGLADNGFTSDWMYDLSDQDKKFVGMIYPFDEVTLKVGSAPVDGAITKAGAMASYKFEVPAQGTFKIETTGTMPVQMSLMGPNSRGEFLLEDHGSGQGPNGLIKTPLSPGNYFVKIAHQLNDSTGAFKISVVPA